MILLGLTTKFACWGKKLKIAVQIRSKFDIFFSLISFNILLSIILSLDTGFHHHYYWSQMSFVCMSIPSLVLLACEVCIKWFCFMKIIQIDGISARICYYCWYNAWFVLSSRLASLFWAFFLLVLAFLRLCLFFAPSPSPAVSLKFEYLKVIWWCVYLPAFNYLIDPIPEQCHICVHACRVHERKDEQSNELKSVWRRIR